MSIRHFVDATKCVATSSSSQISLLSSCNFLKSNPWNWTNQRYFLEINHHCESEMNWIWTQITRIFLALFYIYPIVPYTPASLHIFLLLLTVVRSFIFLLIGTGLFLALFYIHLIVPHTPASLHSFLLLVTVAKAKGPNRHTYFYSLVLEFFLCYSTSIR